MRFEKSPSSFIVEEILKPELGGGEYKYYIMEKAGIDTARAIKLIERHNSARVHCSGLKDSDSTSMQWICSAKELECPEGESISLEYAGSSKKRIFVGMHTANRFIVKLAEISENERKIIPKILRREAFPNYFDSQRFSKKGMKAAGFLLAGDYEGAAKEMLAKAEGFESDKSKEIKKIISEKWGKWKELEADPAIPAAKKLFFSEMAAGKGAKECIGLLEPKALSIACKAGQAMEFNSKLGEMIRKQNAKEMPEIEIAGEKFPATLKPKGIKRQITIGPIFPKKAKLERKTSFAAEQPKATFSGGGCVLEFTLRKGRYATILIKCLQAICEKEAR